MITRNVWSKISLRESPYASFPLSFIRKAVVLIIVVGSGMLLPSIMSKLLPLLDKIHIGSRTVDLVIWVTLAGFLLSALILLLRQNELAATVVIAINIVIDSYLSLFFVSLVMALVVLLILYLGRSSRYPWVVPRVLWLWALFLVLAIFPIGQTITPFDGIQYYLKDFLAAFIVFWLGTVIARDMTRVRYLFGLLAVFGAFVAIVTIIQTVTGVMPFSSSSLQGAEDYQLVSGIYRSGAFLVNPNSNAGFLAMVLPITLGLLIEVPSLLRKAFYLILAFLILLALLFTYSTEGILAALAGILSLIILAGRTRTRIFFPLLIFGCGIVVIIFLPAQIGLLLQHASDPGELSLRMGAWQTAMRVILAFPLTGVGLGGYVYRVRAEPYRVPAQYIVLDHPHNAYLEFAALAGLPILIVFLTLLILFLGLALRNWMKAGIQARPLLGTGVAVVIVLSFFSLSDAGWTFPPLLALGWLVLGVISSPLLTKDRNSQMT